jgi:hypothetical protein
LLAFDPAPGTDLIGTSIIVAFLVSPDVVGVRIGNVAVAAHEGTIQNRVTVIPTISATTRCIKGRHTLLILDDAEVFLCAGVKTHPNRGQLSERAESGAAELIYVVAKHVGAFYKLGADSIDCQLELAKVLLIEENIDEDVVSAQLQTILHSHDL